LPRITDDTGSTCKCSIMTKMKESSACALRNHVEFPALSVRGTPKAVAG